MATTATTGTTAAELATRASDAERRETTDRLKRACVEGRLTLDEFGERVRGVLAARTRGDLQALMEDLPAPSSVSAPAAGTGLAATAGASGASLERRRAVATTVAFMSTADRTGRWRIDEQSRVIAVMGTCKIDLRQVTISSPLTVIRAYVLMGNVNVIVPEGVEVELDGLAVMGSRSLKLKGAPPGPGAPVVRVEGMVLMGDLTVRDKA